MNITYKEKDAVLKVLCENFEPETMISASREDVLRTCGVDSGSFSSILAYFQRNSLVREVNFRHGAESFYLIVNIEAFDLYNRGGFTATEELLTKNIQKLLLEIESLKPSMPDRISTITTIASNITTALGFFVGK